MMYRMVRTCGPCPILKYDVRNNMEALQELLQQIEQGSASGSTLSGPGYRLFKACQNGHYTVANSLLDHGTDVDSIVDILTDESQTMHCFTPLFAACCSGHTDIVKLLLDRGANIKFEEKETGWLPIFGACENGHCDIVKLLLEKGAEINLQKKDGLSVLMAATANGHAEVVNVLAKNGAEVNVQDSKGRSALMYASGKGHHCIAKILIQYGAEVNMRNELHFEMTALMYAIIYGHSNVVETLLENGADVNILQSMGLSALSLACQTPATIVVIEQLLKRGAGVNVRDSTERSPLMYASENGFKDIVQLLLTNGADPNMQDEKGMSALMYTLEHFDVAETLVENGADLNLINALGLSALSFACATGKTEAAKLLIAHKCDRTIKDIWGRTALDWACENGCSDIVELLLPAEKENVQGDQDKAGISESFYSLLALVNAAVDNQQSDRSASNESVETKQSNSPRANKTNPLEASIIDVGASRDNQLDVSASTPNSSVQSTCIEERKDTVTIPADSANKTQDQLCAPSSEIQTVRHSLSQLCPPGQSFDLPGVEVTGRTTLVVTNSVQSFYWDGYGFKLHIPQDSLPAGVDNCQLDIIASVAGQYQLPDNHELFSAVYWAHTTPPCRFKQQLTVEIQHCANNSSSKLKFVSSDINNQSSYSFAEMDNSSSFNESSSYGCLKLDHFCGVGVAAEGSVEKKYCSNVYYLGEDLHSKDIHFVIVRNLDICITMLKNYYEQFEAVCERSQLVSFQSDSIQLDIPDEGVTDQSGWLIEPLTHPEIFKRDVDKQLPGEDTVFPHCQLSAEYSPITEDTTKVPKLSYRVNMIGAKEPFTYFRIRLDPNKKSTLTAASRPTSQPGPVAKLPAEHDGIVVPGKNTTPIITELDQPSSEVVPHPSSQLYPLPPSQYAGSIVRSHHQFMSMQGVAGSPPLALQQLLGTFSASAIHPSPLSIMPGSPVHTGYRPVTLDQFVDHMGIDKDLLSKQCSSEHQEEISGLINWRDYANYLKLTHHQILDIAESKSNSAIKAQEVIRKWYNNDTIGATYLQFIEVCLSKGDGHIAEAVCRMVKNDLSRPALTGKRRREEVTEHTEEEQVSTKRPRNENM